MRIVAQPDRTLTLSQLREGPGRTSRAARLKMRSDGTFSSDAKPLTSYRAVETCGLRYLVQRDRTGPATTSRVSIRQRIEPRPQ